MSELMNLLKKLGPEGGALLEKLKGGAMKAGKWVGENPGKAALGAGVGGLTLDMLMNQDEPRYADPKNEAIKMAKKQGKYGF